MVKNDQKWPKRHESAQKAQNYQYDPQWPKLAQNGWFGQGRPKTVKMTQEGVPTKSAFFAYQESSPTQHLQDMSILSLADWETSSSFQRSIWPAPWCWSWRCHFPRKGWMRTACRCPSVLGKKPSTSQLQLCPFFTSHSQGRFWKVQKETFLGAPCTLLSVYIFLSCQLGPAVNPLQDLYLI